MSDNKEDLRIKKTHKYLHDAMRALLRKQNFRHITVRDLCNEALISRAAFYSHYRDKYELLQSWFSCLLKSYDEKTLETIMNKIIWENMEITEHIFDDADSETLDIFFSFLAAIFDKFFEKEKRGEDYRVLSNFCVGGMVQTILWQIKNKDNVTEETKTAFYKMIKFVMESKNYSD